MTGLELLIPALIKGAVELFTNDPETTKEVVKTVVENPVTLVTGAAASVSVPLLVSRYITGHWIPRGKREKVLKLLHGILVPVELIAHYSAEGVKWINAAIKSLEESLKAKREEKEKGD